MYIMTIVTIYIPRPLKPLKMRIQAPVHWLAIQRFCQLYPVPTSFRPPRTFLVSFYLVSRHIVLILALCHLSVKEQQT